VLVLGKLHQKQIPRRKVLGLAFPELLVFGEKLTLDCCRTSMEAGFVLDRDTAV
jgi:hypothetical protein